MRENRFVVLFLAVATVAVDAVLLVNAPEKCQWPDGFVAVLLGMASGQVDLVTIWVVLGRRMVPWRLAALVTAPIVWGVAISLSMEFEGVTGYATAAGWAVHFLTQTALLAPVLLVVRLAGASLVSKSSVAATPPGRRLQFTLACLFGWLTATAITLSALKSAFSSCQVRVDDFDWRGILILDLVNAAIGLISVWLLLDARSMSARWSAFLITAIPAVCAVGYAARVTDESRLWALLLEWLAAAIYLLAASGAVRVAGYRIESLAAAAGPVRQTRISTLAN